MLHRWVALIFLAAALCFSATASSAPRMNAHALSKAPVVDGDVLADPIWQAVTATGNFVQVRPVEGRPASQRTEVRVAFTDTALYIGVVCFDDNPAGIVVADSRRDSTMDDTK